MISLLNSKTLALSKTLIQAEMTDVDYYNARLIEEADCMMLSNV
jgi:hypothetical protein